MRCAPTSGWSCIPRPSQALGAGIKKQVRNAFYTDDDDWRQRVVEQAFDAMRQGVEGAGRPPLTGRRILSENDRKRSIAAATSARLVPIVRTRTHHPPRESRMNTALLLIDIQESFRHRPYFRADALPNFLARTNALVDGCAGRGIPVVRILHADSGDPPTRSPSHRGLVRPLEGLARIDAAAEFVKSRHSALVGTGLSVWLRQRGIGRLIVTGIRTEQCCETTTRHASDEGFEVDFVPEATLTFDMQHLDGSPLRAADIVARTAAVLKGRFAAICSVEEALARAGLIHHAPCSGPTPIDVLFVLPTRALLLDLAGPAEALRLANMALQEAGRPPRFRLRYTAADTRVDSSVGLAMAALEPLPRTLEAPTWLVLVGQPSAMLAAP
jgi:nicotinamidase-related amidase